MILPRGNSVWTNLSLSFIIIDEFMRYLKKNDFTGCIHFIFNHSQGLVLFQEGDIVNGTEENNGIKATGQDAVDRIIKKTSEEPKGVVSVSEFSVETISILSEVFSLSTTLLHEKLSAEFSNIIKFVDKLKKDTFTGYIELAFPKDRREGIEIVVFEKGQISALFTRNYQFRVNEKNKNDAKHIENYLKLAQDASVIYNVFAKS